MSDDLSKLSLRKPMVARKEIIYVRFSQGERELLERASAREKIPLSTLVRAIVRSAIVQSQRQGGKLSVNLGEVEVQL